jgi:hypothetical protein
MSYLETEILLAVLNEDEAEADRLAAGMLIGELNHFSGILVRTKRIADRYYWMRKSQMEASK